LNALDEVAERNRTTPASVAIAWLLSRPVVTAPIASATSLTQLKDLIQAVELNLDKEALALLNQSSD
jgi:aryl-alcohol dehydrogenase-like predicted oxidoreductase